MRSVLTIDAGLAAVGSSQVGVGAPKLTSPDLECLDVVTF